MVEGQTRVVRSSGCSERSLLPDGNTVDLRALAGDLADTVTTICSDTVAEALLAVTYSNDALTVAIPCNIVDPTSDDLIFTCWVSENGCDHAAWTQAYPS